MISQPGTNRASHCVLSKLRWLALSMSLLLLLFTACSESGNNTEAPSEKQETVTTDTDIESVLTEEDEDAIPAPDIPDDADWEGAGFTIIYPGWSLYEHYLTSDEMNGDVMNDAMFNRTASVNDRLNVQIQFVTVGYIDTILTEVRKTVTSGDNAYDMAVTHCINGLQGLLSDKLILDWIDIPYVDLTKPYWNSSILEQLSIDGITPFAASDMLIADPNVIFFNNDIAVNSNLDNLYDIVNEGTWTVDRMTELSDAVVADLNGDGRMTADDQYGVCGCRGWPMISFMYGCGQFVASFDEEGTPSISLMNDNAVTMMEKLYKLFCEGNRSYFTSEDRYIPFETNHALFYFLSLSSMEQYRNTEVDYGIIPFPKLDENQEEYISLNWTGLQCIPKSCRNPEMTGMVSELLAYESRIQVLPAYFDSLLDGKIARHDETRKMLDIIFDTCVYDFGMNFSNQSNFLYMLPDLIGQNSTDIASYYSKNIKVATKTYEKIIKAYRSLKD